MYVETQGFRAPTGGDEWENGTTEFALPAGQMSDIAKHLLRSIGIEHYVTWMNDRRRLVTTFAVRTDAPPLAAWSSGELLMWDFLLSLAGRKKVNIGHVCSYFSGTETRYPLAIAITYALGLEGTTP